jgi:hypothetical protein
MSAATEAAATVSAAPEAAAAEAAATERAVTERTTAESRVAHREAGRGMDSGNVNMGRKTMLGNISTARHVALRGEARRRMVRMIVDVVGWNIGQRDISLACNEAAVDRTVVVAWNTWSALSGGRLRCRYGSADPAEQ